MWWKKWLQYHLIKGFTVSRYCEWFQERCVAVQELKLAVFQKTRMHSDILEGRIFVYWYTILEAGNIGPEGRDNTETETEYCLTLGTTITDLLQDFHLFIQAIFIMN